MISSSSSAVELPFSAAVPAGTSEMRIAFDNDYYAPPADRNLLVDKLSIERAAECA